MKKALMMTVSSLIIALMSFGCSPTNHLAAEIVYDSKVQVNAAKEVDAHNLAPQELADAEQMLSRSEETLGAGKEKEAYRLGMRAYLKAKIAGAIAIANQMEAEANNSEQELELKVQAVESARRDLEQAERELEQLQSTSVDRNPIEEE